MTYTCDSTIKFRTQRKLSFNNLSTSSHLPHHINKCRLRPHKQVSVKTLQRLWNRYIDRTKGHTTFPLQYHDQETKIMARIQLILLLYYFVIVMRVTDVYLNKGNFFNILPITTGLCCERTVITFYILFGCKFFKQNISESLKSEEEWNIAGRQNRISMNHWYQRRS